MTTFLSPKDIARSIGVSESSVKRWVDDGLIEASRTAGGHRRVALAEVIRFVRESKSPVVHPEILGMPEVAEGSDSGALLDYLMTGSSAEARGSILSSYLQGESLESIFDNQIRPAMTRIGELWMERDDGIFVEHRALGICVQAVTQLRLNLPAPEGPLALGGALAGDIYVLPTLMVATVLDSLGFQATNLGADTPFEAMTGFLDQNPSTLLWLSVSTVDDPAQRSRELTSFWDRQGSGDTKIVLGGRELDRLEVPTAAVRFASLSELSAYARGILLAS